MNEESSQFFHNLTTDHEVEQTQKALDTMAKHLARYRAALLASGFTREEAMVFLKDYQEITISASYARLMG